MLGLGKHGPDGRYGVIVDIGSGSIGAAIVASDPSQKNPKIVWSHRERMIVRADDTLRESSKNITSALLNTFLEIGSSGIKKLAEYEKNSEVDLVQISVSSPWSYTITKTVSYKQNEPFEITKNLVEDLVSTAQRQAIDAIDENGIIEKLGLETIVRATISITANEYVVDEPYGQEAKTVDVSHVCAIAHKKLIQTAIENSQKILPKADTERYSFMLIFYCVLQDLAPDTSEICLVDVSSEATEIAIVRDGIIKYATHVPVGMYTLARDISTATGIPTEESLAYLQGNISLETTLSPKILDSFNAAIQNYETQISSLFERTGDSLAIPHPLFLHTDSRADTFFKSHIKNAAIAATKTDHSVHLVTEKLLNDEQLSDSSMLISAHFFHRKYGCRTFEQV